MSVQGLGPGGIEPPAIIIAPPSGDPPFFLLTSITNVGLSYKFARRGTSAFHASWNIRLGTGLTGGFEEANPSLDTCCRTEPSLGLGLGLGLGLRVKGEG